MTGQDHVQRPPRQFAARGQPGQALVELSFVLMMLLLMGVGVFEFGRAFHAHLTVIHGARDGARVAMEPGKFDIDIIAAAQAAAAPLSVSVTVVRTSGQIAVAVTHAFTSQVPLINRYWSGNNSNDITHTMVSRPS